MRDLNQIVADAIVHTAGFTRQSSAARFGDKRYRYGGARIYRDRRQKPSFGQEFKGGFLSKRERRFYGR